MNVFSWWLAGLLLPAFWLTAATNVSACVVDQGLRLDFLRHAELVIRAKVVDYKWGRLRSQFTLVPTEIIVGQIKIVEPITAQWTNSTFGMPRKWDGPIDVIVGLDAVFDREGKPIAAITQQSCGPMSIYPDSPELRCKIVNLVYAHAPMFKCPANNGRAE